MRCASMWWAATISLFVCVPLEATLVVGVTVRDGWVVCADKRVYDRARGDVDEAVKVSRIPGDALVAFIGGHRFYRLRAERDGRFTLLPDIFNAERSLHLFLKGRRFVDNKAFWHDIGGHLKNQLTEVFAREPNLQANSHENFKAVFFWLGADRRPRRRVLNVIFVRTSNVTWNVDDTRIERGNKSAVVLEGSLANELSEGQDRRFDAVRGHPQVKPFLRAQPAKASVSRQDAEAFAKRLIELASQRLAELQLTDGHVSPTSDCMSVRRSRLR